MRHRLTALLLVAIAVPVAAAPAAGRFPSTTAPAPHAASVPAATDHPSTPASQRNRPQLVAHHVDINSAGRDELMTLPGIGSAEADRIVAHRPYLTKTELVSKQVLQTGPFLSIRHQIVAMQKFKPKGKG